MLSDREFTLLRLLAQQTKPLTSRSLAAQLDVSVRTVKTYVQRINREAPGVVISGQQGYRCDPEAVRALLEQGHTPGDTPQTNEERTVYVLHRLLASDSVDIFDLCEQLFVSYSTIKGVVSAIRGKLSPFHLGLKLENNHLQITGRERDKRRLVSDLLYNEATVNFLDLKTVQQAFPQIDIAYIEACVRSVLGASHCFANDYSMINLVLHVAITIDRIQGGRTVSAALPKVSTRASASEGDGDATTSGTEAAPDQTSGVIAAAGADSAIGPQELEMARTIARELERHFNVELDATEVSELALLLASRTTMLDYRTASRENIERFVGAGCLEIVNEMIADLKENAGIDLSEHEFYVRFALHVKNLIVRARTGGLSKNPLTLQIKTSCPLLYDTAVVEADLLQRRAGIHVNDDEIAYIAFHLGSTLETQKQLTNKVKAVLYCPSYYNIDAKILLFLNRHFEEDLLVTNVVTDEGDLGHLAGAELLITTVPVNAYYGVPTYLVSIVPTEADRAHIRRMVDDIRAEKRRRALRSHLEGLIEPALFEVNTRPLDRDEVIHLMAERLHARGYVTEDFERQVREREELSSTVYGTIALPHALRLASLHSSISVMLSRAPISWGDAKVNLVVMLSFSKSDQEVFYEVFDPLVSVLANREQASALMDATDYESFIARLCEMME